MRPSVFLLTLGLILFLVHSSSGLKCYYCTPVLDPNACDKPKLESEDCDAKKTFCGMKVENGKITTRMCWEPDQKKNCEKDQSDTVKCHTCNTDYCNKDMPGGKGHGNPLRSSIWMWPVTTLLAVGYLSYF